MQDNCTIDIRLLKVPPNYLPPPPLETGGGEVVFLGRTRGEHDPELGRLVALKYDAYENLALKKMREIATRAAREFHAIHIILHHTVGKVPIGAPSVFIQVLCPHRTQAFGACRFLIDQLKTSVPIWKCEIWEHGKTSWKDGTPVSTTGSSASVNE